MRVWVSLGLLAAFVLPPACAQNIHIQSMKGSVAVLRGDGDQAAPRALDSVLVTGDRVVTGEKSEAEVALDAANSVHLAAGSELRLAEIYPGRYQFVLVQGGVEWTVHEATLVEGEIATPSVWVRPRERGTIGVVLNAAGETEISAFEGGVAVFAATGSQWLAEGEKMIARGPVSNPEFRIVGRVGRWRRLLRVISNMQIGAVMSSFGSGDSGSDTKARKFPPTAAEKRNPPPVHNSGGHGQPGHRSPEPAGHGHEVAGGNRSGGASHTASNSGGGSHSSSGGSSGASHSSSGGSSGASASHSSSTSSSSSSGSHGK